MCATRIVGEGGWREAEAGSPLVGDLASLEFFCSFQEDEV